MSFRIREVHVICAIDDDGDEGVPAFVSQLYGAMPLISADPTRLRIITEMAQRIADETGKQFTISKFSVREDIGEIVSKRKLS